jgi:hypothetical protein
MKTKPTITTNIHEPHIIRHSDPGPVDWEQIAKGLWMLLDDISTSYDHYRPNEFSLRTCMQCLNYISSKTKDRNHYMYSPDGYELVPYGVNELPKIDDTDAMTRWFRDAWKIERKV